MSNFYVTTSIAYVNAPPHIGFAMEAIQADVYARYNRLIGNETYFLTGTDEHGTKLYELAKELKKKPIEICNKHVKKFEGLKEILNLTNDDFIRTTDQKKHWPSVNKMWQKLVDKGDIYKGTYKGFYCVGCEAFITKSDLVDGLCPQHKKEPKVIEEENYFFKLSKYSDQVRDLIESDELMIMPGNRKKEILNFIDKGLQDVSFSRPKKNLNWGVPVPNDKDQVMYVWCDALTNYISALDYEKEGKLYKKYWDNKDAIKTHIIGKDILRFHAAIWPAMLLAAEVPLPDQLYVHGFITSEGQKMSKSLGNVVDPFEIQKKYGTEALRYYLMREIPSGGDGDFSIENFEKLYQADLANNLGNLVNRILTMVTKYNVKFDVEADDFRDEVAEVWQDYIGHMDDFEIHQAIEEVIKLLDSSNFYIDSEKPWELANTDEERLAEVLDNLAETLRHISLMLYPVIPEAASEIYKRLGLGDLSAEKIDIEEEKEWGRINKGQKVTKGEPLFPRLEG